MQSAVQHLGGMCCGSFTDSLKIRFKQSWHCRWPHLSLADLLLGISSDRHTTHSKLQAVSIIQGSLLYAYSFSGSTALTGFSGVSILVGLLEDVWRSISLILFRVDRASGSGAGATLVCLSRRCDLGGCLDGFSEGTLSASLAYVRGRISGSRALSRVESFSRVALA